MDQPGNNPSGGAPLANSAHPADPTDLMAQLTQAITTLTDVLTMSLANSLSKVKVMQKPSSFKGEQGIDARWFLEAYEMWTAAQDMALNVVDWQKGEVQPRKADWICAVLSFLQDKVTIWASPAMEEFV